MRLIPSDRFDRRLWSQTYDDSPTLKALGAHETGMPSWSDLLADVFTSLYKSDPAFPDPSSVATSHRLHADTLTQTRALPEWEQLRTSTVFDPLLSAMGTAALGEQLQTSFQTKPEFQRALHTAAQAAALEQLLAALEALPANDPLPSTVPMPPTAHDPGSTSPPAPTVQDGIDALTTQLSTLTVSPVPPDQLRQTIRHALQQASQEIDQFQTACTTFGTAPGQSLQLTPADRLQLAQALKRQSKLQELARLLGRMTPLVRHAWMSRSQHDHDEVTSITRGQDLTRLVPTELIALRHPLLRQDFRRRFVEHALLQFQLQGQTPAGRGPLVILIDESGSMKGPKELWSKALALALIGLVRHERRDAAVILFSSETEQLTLRFRPGQDAADPLITLASHFFDGGTNFEVPLRQGLTLLTEDPALKQADLLLLTDGLSTVSAQWLQDWRTTVDKTDCRAITVLFGVPEPAPSHPVAQFSSKCFTLPNLLDDTAVLTTIAQQITSPR